MKPLYTISTLLEAGKVISFFVLLFSFSASYGQQSRNELADCNIYYSATTVDGDVRYTSISVRTVMKDTVIDGTEYRKYRFSTFTDYTEDRHDTDYFESFENNYYSKLVDKLKRIHGLNFTEKVQRGVLFGQDVDIRLAYEDTRRYVPRDSLVPDGKTPRRFYSVQD